MEALAPEERGSLKDMLMEALALEERGSLKDMLMGEHYYSRRDLAEHARHLNLSPG